MRLALSILTVLIICNTALSQTAISQDFTVYSFTVQVSPFNEIARNTAIGKKFRVIKSDFRFPVYTIFIQHEKVYRPLKEGKTYLIKGFAVFKKRLVVDGCFGGSREEYTLYVNPVYFVLGLSPEEN